MQRRTGGDRVARAGGQRLLLAALAIQIGLAPGCSGGLPGRDLVPPTSSVVDPQVMQDVIESTFMVPGPGVQRGMRVRQCGRNEGHPGM